MDVLNHFSFWVFCIKARAVLYLTNIHDIYVYLSVNSCKMKRLYEGLIFLNIYWYYNNGWEYCIHNGYKFMFEMCIFFTKQNRKERDEKSAFIYFLKKVLNTFSHHSVIFIILWCLTVFGVLFIYFIVYFIFGSKNVVVFFLCF